VTVRVRPPCCDESPHSELSFCKLPTPSSQDSKKAQQARNAFLLLPGGTNCGKLRKSKVALDYRLSGVVEPASRDRSTYRRCHVKMRVVKNGNGNGMDALSAKILSTFVATRKWKCGKGKGGCETIWYSRAKCLLSVSREFIYSPMYLNIRLDLCRDAHDVRDQCPPCFVLENGRRSSDRKGESVHSCEAQNMTEAHKLRSKASLDLGFRV